MLEKLSQHTNKICETKTKTNENTLFSLSLSPFRALSVPLLSALPLSLSLSDIALFLSFYMSLVVSTRSLSSTHGFEKTNRETHDEIKLFQWSASAKWYASYMRIARKSACENFCHAHRHCARARSYWYKEYANLSAMPSERFPLTTHGAIIVLRWARALFSWHTIYPYLHQLTLAASIQTH